MFLVLLLIWIVLNGRMTAEVVLVGAAVSAALTFLARPVWNMEPRRGRRNLRRLPGVFLYLLYLAGQVVLANFLVMKRIFRPRRDGDRPRLVTFDPGLKGEGTTALLANSITLTPGTVTAGVGEDGKLCVYALDGAFARGLEDSGFVRRLKKLEERDHG